MKALLEQQSPVPLYFHPVPSPLDQEEIQVPPIADNSKAARSHAAERQEKDCDSYGGLAAVSQQLILEKRA